MEYVYNTAIEAIISLENAYTNKCLKTVLLSKDFIIEAKILLKEASHDYDINDTELVNDTAKLLKITLTQSLNENGFPSFEFVKREFSELQKIDNEIYFIQEKLFFPNDRIYSNKIFLSHIDNIWKVAMIVE